MEKTNISVYADGFSAIVNNQNNFIALKFWKLMLNQSDNTKGNLFIKL